MPELPEVEVTRRVLASSLVDSRVDMVDVRAQKLRQPVPPDLNSLVGQTLDCIDRRGKSLLFQFSDSEVSIHLGMTGSLRLVPPEQPIRKADYVMFEFESIQLRFHDQRKFGSVVWARSGQQGAPAGVEPLTDDFTADYLASLQGRTRRRIKDVLMDNAILLGVGNIYASESLFRAGVRPDRPLPSLGEGELICLVDMIKQTLAAAISAGCEQSELFLSDGILSGYFDYDRRVYGRKGEPCSACGDIIQIIKIAGRSSFYCPKCQK